jgi:hypothetical protein
VREEELQEARHYDMSTFSHSEWRHDGLR